ncbi:hypothetical protein PIB30_084117, partial [Stylosanthes scabra]|nr:hypothetical protein [Stylosanthes scabra]
MDDMLVWSQAKDENYSVKSFLQVHYKNKEHVEDANMYNFMGTLWKSLVPPLVELLMWFVILEKLNTRQKLM